MNERILSWPAVSEGALHLDHVETGLERVSKRERNSTARQRIQSLFWNLFAKNKRCSICSICSVRFHSFRSIDNQAALVMFIRTRCCAESRHCSGFVLFHAVSSIVLLNLKAYLAKLHRCHSFRNKQMKVFLRLLSPLSRRETFKTSSS